MAYPANIKEDGALSTYSDIFDYFKGAHFDAFESPEPENYTSRSWQSALSLLLEYTVPSTKTAFLNYISDGGEFTNFQVSSSQYIWDFPEPVSGWTIN